MRRLLALILAAIAVFLVAPEATVTGASVRSDAVYTYDGHAHSAPSIGGTSERGPPTEGNHFAVDNAVDRRSHGNSTRSDIGESPAAYAYNDPTRVGDWANANNVELACIPFYGSWRNTHVTDPKQRKLLKRAATIKRAKVA